MSVAHPSPDADPAGTLHQSSASSATFKTHSRRTSTHHSLDAASNPPTGSLDQSTLRSSSPWDSIDITSVQTSPGFPYTPNYRDSFTPSGSPRLGWSSLGPDGNPLTDEPTDMHELDYNPADFDAHGSYSNSNSPFLVLDGDITLGGPSSRLPPDFLSGSAPVEMSLNHTFNTSKRMDGTQTSFGSIDFPSNGSLPPRPYSPRPDYSAPSPASSAGHPAEQEHIARSRASSFSSMVRQPTPGVSEAFDKLGFDTVDSDLLWRNQQQQQQSSQKPNSPPQLFIPSESGNTSLQIPSFGPSLGPPGMGGGSLGLAAPSINLLPATPVSGGASGNHVPFQQVLRNLNEQRQQHSQGENGLNSMSSHGESYFCLLYICVWFLSSMGPGQCPPRR
jgi:hypothetical protein